MENDTFDKINTWIGERFELCQYDEDKDEDEEFHEMLKENAMGFNFKDALDLGLARSKSKLTKSEIMFILDLVDFPNVEAYLPTWLKGGLSNIVRNGMYVDNLDYRYNVDRKALLDKLSSLTYLETWAVLNCVFRFWEDYKTALMTATSDFIQDETEIKSYVPIITLR